MSFVISLTVYKNMVSKSVNMYEINILSFLYYVYENDNKYYSKLYNLSY